MAFYIAPQFLDRLAVHITKNYLNLPNVKVPLILGVHGRKGEGKSFQCDLVYQRMGLEVVYMSAGELESPDAGDPARLIRLRYREAGELSRVRGKMAVLMINDIDAGMGRVDALTQYTVNTQLVHGTLMNIADSPTNVQLPGSYDSNPTTRIPIIVTGNDFSTLYAPLTRDGRMEKYYWEPSDTDRLGIVTGIFAVDQVPDQDIKALVRAFPGQSIDFFGALRSRLYDEQVKQLIQDVGVEKISARVANAKENLPEFRRPDMHLEHLIQVGQSLVGEQQRLQELRLVEEYNQSIFSNRRLGQAKPSKLTPEIIESINQILQDGDRLGIEHVDDRRFRTGVWTCYGTFQGNPAEAIAGLEQCLSEHDRDYIQIVGINPQTRQRRSVIRVQQPQ
jgi:ribulose bisphosphate carboxylase small subunit